MDRRKDFIALMRFNRNMKVQHDEYIQMYLKRRKKNFIFMCKMDKELKTEDLEELYEKVRKIIENKEEISDKEQILVKALKIYCLVREDVLYQKGDVMTILSKNGRTVNQYNWEKYIKGGRNA